jgi:murein DD-endopeptidase MepM/ murein hydrolase activator NlpD
MIEDSSSHPADLPENKREAVEDGLAAKSPKPGRQWAEIWESLLRLGLGETALRIGTGVVSIALILLVVWVMGNFYLKGRVQVPHEEAAFAAALPTPTPTVAQPVFSPQDIAMFSTGIPRLAQMHTNRPNRTRFEITQYVIEKGDSVFAIADKFGLTPSSILFGNFETMADDPHRIYPGQKINILPVDGVLYRWHAGDGLNGVAKFFGVSPEDILDWPGNKLNRDTIGDLTNPKIAPDTMVLIPGGKRAFISWSAPLISRKDPAKAKIFGPGFCGVQTDGAVGRGAFVYPTPLHWLSGFDFTPGTNHWGVDLAGQMGSPIFAADSGVIVYAGWNDWGYGNVLVIDHGNGWQTLYAHLSQLNVGCGSSVSQAQTIALMGSTGRSTGPHLHFEIMNAGGVRVDPHSFLPAP